MNANSWVRNPPNRSQIRVLFSSHVPEMIVRISSKLPFLGCCAPKMDGTRGHSAKRRTSSSCSQPSALRTPHPGFWLPNINSNRHFSPNDFICFPKVKLCETVQSRSLLDVFMFLCFSTAFSTALLTNHPICWAFSTALASMPTGEGFGRQTCFCSTPFRSVDGLLEALEAKRSTKSVGKK